MFQGFRKEYIKVKKGKIFCRIAGKGPAILLLHGYPQTHVMWNKIAPVMAKKFFLVIPDLRGYGDSGKPAANGDHNVYCKRATAQDQVEVMAELGHRSFHVVGHDIGWLWTTVT